MHSTDLTRETDVGMRRHIAPDGGGQLGLVVPPPQLLHLHPTPAILPATFSALQHTTLKKQSHLLIYKELCSLYMSHSLRASSLPWTEEKKT